MKRRKAKSSSTAPTLISVSALLLAFSLSNINFFVLVAFVAGIIILFQVPLIQSNVTQWLRDKLEVQVPDKPPTETAIQYTTHNLNFSEWAKSTYAQSGPMISVPPWEEKAEVSTGHLQPITQSPHVEGAIRELLEFIIRDFIRVWHDKLNPDDNTFEVEVKEEFCNLIRISESRARKVDMVAIVCEVMEAIRHHLASYRFAREQSKMAGSPDDALSVREGYIIDAMNRYDQIEQIPAQFAVPNASTKGEIAYFSKFVDVMLFISLNANDFNSRLVRTLCKDIIAGKVLVSALDVMCEPDWIYRKIQDVLPTAEKQLRKIQKREQKQRLEQMKRQARHTIAITKILKVLKDMRNNQILPCGNLSTWI